MERVSLAGTHGTRSLFKRSFQGFLKAIDHVGNRRVSIPAAPVFSLEELSMMIRDAADEYARVRNTSEKPGGPFLTLVTSLCYRHVLSLLSSRRHPIISSELSDTKAESLLDFLLCMCEHPQGLSESLLEKHQGALALLLSLSLTDNCVAPSTGDSENNETVEDSFTFTVTFCAALAASWRLEKSMQWSLMPWSERARKEGIPPPRTSYTDQAVTALMSNEAADLEVGTFSLRDDLFYFPDMRWLSGQHDGHSLATTLSAYFWLRLPNIKSRLEHLALWQAALSFGVLEAITGLHIPEQLLLSAHPDGNLSLSSKKVSLVISSWLFDTSPTTSRALIRQKLDHAYEMVTWALSAINEAALYADTGILRDTGLTSHELDDIVCSLYTLSSMLHHFFSSVCKAYGMSKIPVWLPAAGKPVLHTYERILVANGWCPYTMELLDLKVEPLVYASASAPFFRRSPEEHAQCIRGPVGRGRCVAHNINTAEYKTQHAPTCAQSDHTCRFLLPSLDRVVELLSAGQIPVIVYDPETSTLHVNSASNGAYVAISHVWADGLGSTTEAGLPACQIARIAAYAHHLVPSGSFWVDALCVPALRNLRKRAIRLMADTYRRADAVVVLDAGLRTLCASTTPLKELAFRITTSSWMQRVWTLQEALFARDILFELSDGLFPIQQLNDAYKRSLEPVPSSLGPIPIDFDLHLFLEALGDGLFLMLHRQARTFSFKDIVSLLQNRMTSKLEDETVAIAGLLGVDLSKLLAENDVDSRIKAFLLEMKQLPADVIFASTNTNLKDAGFRWAPRALVGLQPASIREHSGMAQCTQDGLTTEQKFDLISLPLTQIGNSDTHPDVLHILNPANGATYVLAGLKTLVGNRCLAFNLLVIAPGHLESLKEGSSMIFGVAAYAAGLDEGSSKYRSSARQPVTCEHVLVVYISEVTDMYSKSMSDLTSSGGPPTIEGRLLMARITMT